MNKRELKQFYGLGREIYLQQSRLERLGRKLIYLPEEEQPKELLAMRAALQDEVKKRQRQQREIANFIQSLPDSNLRQIFLLRYAERCTWRQIALRMGGGVGEDAVRKRHDRFFAQGSGQKK